jgi:hypothetical protein
MPGKRQHYVPRFLARRFVIDPSDKRSLICKLDKATGRPLKVNPVNEMVVGHYYRIVEDDGTVIDAADDALDRIESMAAEVVPKLSNAAYIPGGNDTLPLILLIVALKNRTPQAREELREFDEQAAELQFETMLSDRAQYHEAMGKGRSDGEAEAERLQLLEDLTAGRIGMASTPEREVALMFTGFEEVTNTLCDQLGIQCVRVPAGGKATFVLSDHPVAHYDPKPKTPESGVGFISSPQSVTWVPLDPSFGLLLSPQNPRTWQDIEATDDDVDELNLLAYGWARDAIYGNSQDAVTRVRHYARKHPAMAAELRYRPPRLWLSRAGDDSAGPHEFVSRHKGQSVIRKFYVQRSDVE